MTELLSKNFIIWRLWQLIKRSLALSCVSIGFDGMHTDTTTSRDSHTHTRTILYGPRVCVCACLYAYLYFFALSISVLNSQCCCSCVVLCTFFFLIWFDLFDYILIYSVNFHFIFSKLDGWKKCAIVNICCQSIGIQLELAEIKTIARKTIKIVTIEAKIVNWEKEEHKSAK